MKVSDHLLIRKTLDGQWDAFEKIIEKYQRAVFAIAWTFSGNSSQAEEWTEQIFTKVYQSLEMLGDFRKFGKWLSFTATNHCKDLLGTTSPPQQQTSPENLKVLHQLLGQLPETNRLVLALKFHTGFSYEELADFLDVPVNTVRGIMYKGTKYLNQKLSNQY